MRMWMVEPRCMCNKHLLGEHVETHMFVGTLKKKRNIAGYINNNLFEPESLGMRHDFLVAEMKKRNMNHNSELNDHCDLLDYLPIDFIKNKVDVLKSAEDLYNRCSDCRKLYEEYKKN